MYVIVAEIPIMFLPYFPDGTALEEFGHAAHSSDDMGQYELCQPSIYHHLFMIFVRDGLCLQDSSMLSSLASISCRAWP
jgi:hypothetical protein